MKKIFALAALAIGFVSSAEAATYRYDVVLKRTDLTVLGVFGYGDPDRPDKKPRGVKCSTDEMYGGHTCQGNAKFKKNTPDYDFLAPYKKKLKASFTIEAGEYSGWEGDLGVTPTCIGSGLICDYFDSAYEITATPESFDIFASNGYGYIYNLSDDGLSYEDDGGYYFDYGSTSYSSAGNGMFAGYRMKKMAISAYPEAMVQIVPNPLPASGWLLGAAAAGMGLLRRRKSAKTA